MLCIKRCIHFHFEITFWKFNIHGNFKNILKAPLGIFVYREKIEFKRYSFFVAEVTYSEYNFHAKTFLQYTSKLFLYWHVKNVTAIYSQTNNTRPTR